MWETIQWEVVQNIGTPLALAAFIVAVIGALYSNKLRQKIDLLNTIPEDKRASIIEKEMETYHISNDNLTKSQKFELMKAVIAQRASRLKILILTSFIFAVVLSVSVVVAFSINGDFRNKQDKIALTSLFGLDNDGNLRVEPIARSDNSELLSKKFNLAQKEIKIVTESGNSWLLAEQRIPFKDALSRGVDIEVMLFDYRDKLIFEATDYAVLSSSPTKLDYDFHRKILRQYGELYNKGLKIRMHRFYMWTRFTIFDNKAVSFVLTPLLRASGGSRGIQPFYSDDPVVVELFKYIYESVRRNSRGFDSTKEVIDYSYESELWLEDSQFKKNK